MDASIQKLEDYIKKNKERIITSSSNNTSDIKTSIKITKTRKQTVEEKQLYGYFK